MDDRSNIEKYLSQYAEPEARDIRLSGRYDHVLVIPTYAESPEQVIKVWQSIKGKFLVILVINCPETGPDKQTEALAARLEKSASNILVVDRYSTGKRIPVRQGVGLARKIGCDIALSLINQSLITDNWIFTTDADVRLPERYFCLADEIRKKNSAAIFPFQHYATPKLARACHNYELSMLYYAAGLKWAGSDYAYTTIGSTLSFSANHYARVRGFPKRNTGEDFYLLNKLRKSGNISCLSEPIIEIEGRLSERVPVGTGRAIARLSEPDEAAEIEHPNCYKYLKNTLSWMNAQARLQPANPRFGDPIVDGLLEENGFFEHYDNKIKQSPRDTVMLKHRHDWFDALKTRQFIHRLRDQHFGSVPVEQPGEIPFVPEGTTTENLLATCRKQVFGT